MHPRKVRTGTGQRRMLSGKVCRMIVALAYMPFHADGLWNGYFNRYAMYIHNFDIRQGDFSRT